MINGIGFKAVANTFSMTRFGIVFYWEFALRIVWLLKSEWCRDEISISWLPGSQDHQPNLIAGSYSTILLIRLRLVDSFNYNDLGFC
jgi:hypothetical protein